MNTRSFVIVTGITVGCVVLASLGVGFITPGSPLRFLGMHVPVADLPYIPPVAGVLGAIGGTAVMFAKSKRI